MDWKIPILTILIKNWKHFQFYRRGVLFVFTGAGRGRSMDAQDVHFVSTQHWSFGHVSAAPLGTQLCSEDTLVYCWSSDYSVSSHCAHLRCRAAHENRLEGSIFEICVYIYITIYRYIPIDKDQCEISGGPGQLGTSFQIIPVSTKRQWLDFQPTCLVGGLRSHFFRGLG